MGRDTDRVRERVATMLVTALVIFIVLLALWLLWAFFASSVMTEDELPQSLRLLAGRGAGPAASATA